MTLLRRTLILWGWVHCRARLNLNTPRDIFKHSHTGVRACECIWRGANIQSVTGLLKRRVTLVTTKNRYNAAKQPHMPQLWVTRPSGSTALLTYIAAIGGSGDTPSHQGSRGPEPPLQGSIVCVQNWTPRAEHREHRGMGGPDTIHGQPCSRVRNLHVPTEPKLLFHFPLPRVLFIDTVPLSDTSLHSIRSPD